MKHMNTKEYIRHIRGVEVDVQRNEKGQWLIASLEQTVGWPNEDQIIFYEGFPLLLLGWGDEANLLPSVAVNYEKIGITKDDAHHLVARFLSSLNWSLSNGSISILHRFGGSFPIRTKAIESMKYTSSYFRISYLPQNLTSDLNLALALFREADSLSHTHAGYSFLSFYKVINLVIQKSSDQKIWIRDNLVHLDDETQIQAADLAAAFEKPVEEYLYVSCRCALAHAGIDPTVNPDNIEDSIRMEKGRPIIRALAKHMINTHFGLPTAEDIWRKHLYEVSGFKEVFGENEINFILSNDYVSRRRISLSEPISIRQWNDKRYGVFDTLKTRINSIKFGRVFMQCFSPDRLFSVELIIDFAEDRIYLDVENSRVLKGEGNSQIRHQIDHLRFLDDLLHNGEVEIFLANSGKFLGRKDANLPLNIDQGRTHEVFQNKIEKLEKQLEE